MTCDRGGGPLLLVCCAGAVMGAQGWRGELKVQLCQLAEWELQRMALATLAVAQRAQRAVPTVATEVSRSGRGDDRGSAEQAGAHLKTARDKKRAARARRRRFDRQQNRKVLRAAEQWDKARLQRRRAREQKRAHQSKPRPR